MKYLCAQKWENKISLFRHLLIVLFFIEVGLVLVVVPWTTFWSRNYFIESVAVIRFILMTNVARGCISGVGLLNLGAAIIEVFALIRRRTRAFRCFQGVTV